MITLFVATGNAHKVGEIRAGLGSGFSLLSQRDVGIALEPVENGATMTANAAIKAVTWAVHFSAHGGLSGVQYVLADDSGLEVDVLGGAPGVHSARFAALDDGRPGNSTDAENNAKLRRLLTGVAPEKCSARFRCVLALTPLLVGADQRDLSARTRWFEGICEGRIQLQARGSGGFGYDPWFVPEGETQSFAELRESKKNQLSHRGRALAILRSQGDLGTLDL